jgi:hypothetical protein
MKFLWNALAVVAVAHLLALGAFAGWLTFSGRLDSQRLHEVRALFSKTTAQLKAEAEIAAAKAAQDAKEAEVRAKIGTAPVAASEALDLKLQLSEIDRARLEAMRREVAILRDTLKRERDALDADRVSLNKDRADFEQARLAVAKTEGNTQFKKALATYEALKPDQAKLALRQLIDAKQTDQAVAYLNAMQERARTRIVDEFLKDDPKVASDLLERLRTRGLTQRAPEGSSG